MAEIKNAALDKLMDNAFVSEMAGRNIKDFKGRSRTNMVPRVAKRIVQEERRVKDMQSTMTSLNEGGAGKRNQGKKAALSVSKSVKSEKVMDYSAIKKWNQKYQLDGKNVYQLDAEFTSLVKIQV